MVTKRTLGEWRKRKGLSQEELADATGLSRPTIARYETNIMNANIHTITAILEKLEIEFNELDLELDKEDK